MSCKVKDCECKGDPKWEVASPAFGNCFFQYLKANGRPHTLQEIADLLKISVSAVTTIEKKSLKKLHRKFQKNSEIKSGML